MKIKIIEFEIDYILEKGRTSRIDILNFEGEDYCTSFFEWGQYQGETCIELLFHRFIFWKIIDFIDEKFGNDPTTAIIRSLRNFLRKFV